MVLFQNPAPNKYLKQQGKDLVAKAYRKFFHNPTGQRDIREIKEEGFRRKFLMELFVTVFGYVINPDPDHNLTMEFKNEKGSKKWDTSIFRQIKAITVFHIVISGIILLLNPQPLL